METRFQTGTVISAVGHLGVILWVLVGDWLFAADPVPEPIVMSVSTLTSAEFDALQAASTPTPSEEPAPVRPEPRPEPAVEPEPVPVPEPEPEPAPEPEPVPEPVPEPEPAPEPPPSDAVQAEEEQAIQSESTEIQPAPEAEAIIAPDPVQPETEAETSDTPEPAVSEDPAATEVVEQEPTEATVPEDTGDVTQTEANVEQTAETGMTTSVRPRAKPSRPEPQPDVAADTPAEEPAESAQLNVQPVDDSETQDAIDALLGEAAEEPVTEDVASDTGGQDLPQGPPLTGGEMGNISSAISRKWNLGASSTDAMSSLVVVRVSFSADGKPVDFELIESSGPNQTGIDKLYETARRAVNRAHADGGLPLPPEKYDTWRVLDLVFDANGMRAR
jgi:hypothetical protein